MIAGSTINTSGRLSVQREDCVDFDLIRLYIPLRQEPLIHDFFRLPGLRDQTFFDPYLLHAKNALRDLADTAY